MSSRRSDVGVPGVVAVALGLALGCGTNNPARSTPGPAPHDGPAADLDDESLSPAAVAALADAACPRIVRPYFWRVTPPRAGVAPSYLLGTMHIGINPTKLPATVISAFDGATQVVFETDPALDAAEDAAEGPSNLVLPADAPGLDAQLGVELWPRFLTIIGGSLGAPAQVARLTPGTATILLTALYLDKSVSLDGWLGERALGHQQRTGGLETGAFQQDIITRWLDLRALRSAVSLTTTRRQLQQDQRDEVAEYCAGDDDSPGMDAADRADLLRTGYSEADLTAFEAELLYQRNDAWIAPLRGLVDGGGAFIVVGADHLRGDRGVVAQLRAAGLTVDRLD